MNSAGTRGVLRFLDDYRDAGRMAWAECKPPLFVIAAGLAHFPVAFHPRLGDYRWALVGLGTLSVLLGVGCLHMLMTGLDRIANSRARRRAERAGAPEPGPDWELESGSEFESEDAALLGADSELGSDAESDSEAER